MKILLFLFSLAVNHALSQGQKEFILSGQLPDAQSARIYLSFMNADRDYVTDSIETSGSKFKMKGLINVPTYADMTIIQNEKRSTYSFFIEPSNTFLNINGSGYELTGSKTNLDFEARGKMNEKTLAYSELLKSKMEISEPKRHQYYLDLIDSCYEKIARNDVSFIKSHPQSFVSGYLLHSLVDRIPMEEIGSLLQILNLNPAYQDYYSQAAKYLFDRYDSISTNHEYRDFTTMDFKENERTLSDLIKSKMVVLVFWANWCEPCVKELPILKKIKNEFANVEFIIISVDMDSVEWKSSVIKYGLKNFINLSSGVKGCERGTIADKYVVSTIPHSILIGTDGKIIGRYWDLNSLKNQLKKLQVTN